MDKPETEVKLHPVVQECIDGYAKYYAKHHKLGLSIRDDMRYVAEVATRWAQDISVTAKDAARYRWLRDMGIVAKVGQPFVAYWEGKEPMPISGAPLDRELDSIMAADTASHS